MTCIHVPLTLTAGTSDANVWLARMRGDSDTNMTFYEGISVPKVVFLY